MYQELKGFPPYNLNLTGKISHGESGLNPQHAREVGASEDGASISRFELTESAIKARDPLRLCGKTNLI